MKRSPFFIILIALIALIASCAAKPTPTQRLLFAAMDSLKKGDTAQYKELVHRAYVYNPDDPFVINNMGIAAEMDGNLAQARAFYSLAITRAGSLKVVVVTSDSKFGGKLLREMAKDNLNRISEKN